MFAWRPSCRGEPVFRQTLRREDLGKPPNFVLCGSSPVNLAAGEFSSQIIVPWKYSQGNSRRKSCSLARGEGITV